MPFSRRLSSSMGFAPFVIAGAAKRPMSPQRRKKWIASLADGAMTVLLPLALRQEADHRVGEGVRLLDIGNCAASKIVMLAPGIWLRMNSPAETGVDMSWRPAITRVGLFSSAASRGSSSLDSASQQAR